MKKSFYINAMEKGGKTLLYNTLRDTVVAMTTTTCNNFKELPLEAFAEKHPNIYAALVDNKFIIDDELDEIAEIRLRNKLETFSNRRYVLSVMPSMDCNLKCWYCFESHVPDSRMSGEIQERIVKHVRKKIENKEITSLSVEYFGGEPLLDFDKIAYPLGMTLKAVCEEADIPISISFVTNATLIDDEMIPKLVELDADFQITLDGNKEKHNQIRYRKKDDSGTYEHIIEVLHKLTEQIENTHINLRINYDEETLDDIVDILEDISGLNRNKVRIHFEKVWQSCGDEHNEQLKQVINQFMANNFNVSYLNWYLRGCTCKAERLFFLVVNYDGKVFKCTGRQFTDEHSDGELDENGDIQWKPGRLERRVAVATFENPMCLKCKMLPVCMGPCSQKQIDVGQENLHEVCMRNALELRMNEYIEFIYNNMVMNRRREEKQASGE